MDSVVAMGDFASDAAAFSAYWLQANARLRRLPPKAERDPATAELIERIRKVE